MQTIRFLLLSALLMTFAHSAAAQQTQSIRIDDGEVFINERFVPIDELPSSLDVDGIQLQYVFSGDVAPVVRVGDEFFILDEGRLREARPEERGGVSVIVRDGSLRSETHGRMLQSSGEPARIAAAVRQAADHAAEAHAIAAPEFALSAASAPHIVMMQRKAAELQEQADRLQQLQSNAWSRIDETRMREIERAAHELTLRAEEAARAAEAMPQLQVQDYLHSIQQKNEKLFERLVDERELERESLRLAAEIRGEERRDAREEKTARLRERLHDAFELKQDNRRREIEALEERLEELQETLEARERMREEIIERRLRELLQKSDELTW